MVRPLVSLGRSAPIAGIPACFGLHVCFCHWLGCHVQWACSVRGVDGPPTALAHQLPRVSSSTTYFLSSSIKLLHLSVLKKKVKAAPYKRGIELQLHSTNRLKIVTIFNCNNRHLHLVIWISNVYPVIFFLNKVRWVGFTVVQMWTDLSFHLCCSLCEEHYLCGVTCEVIRQLPIFVGCER